MESGSIMGCWWFGPSALSTLCTRSTPLALHFQNLLMGFLGRKSLYRTSQAKMILVGGYDIYDTGVRTCGLST
ncbi:hypothetical protein F4677DRAFT_6713 [Hypoxylon crocopeplum]|nr:hypothetical protein F4677DRAFT_6713 [Hypoxylon crocopeplum]